MNCSRFRHLIQQRFDMDLPAQDERMLSAHLETCESCAKFHHQIQQVLLAADDVQLPDDLTPPQPEALARAIMEDLPEQKASPFAMFGNIFKGKEKPDKKAAAQTGGAPQGGGRGKKDTMPPGMEMEQVGSRFPHRTQPQNIPQQQFEDTSPPQMAAPQAKGKPPEDHTGTATRLKAIAKGMSEPLMDSREAQSTTRSLGEKFGMAGPNTSLDDQPLTLAESIRRKIAESQRATGEHEPISVEDELGPEGSGQREEEEPSWMKPPGLPNRQAVNVPTGLPGQSNPNIQAPSIQMPASSGMPMGGMPQMPPPMPGPNALADSSPQLAGNWGKPTSPQQEASNWGGPPGGGGGGPAGGPPAMPSMPAMPGFPKAPAPGAQPNPGGAWGDPNWGGGDPPKGANGQDADWGPPPAGGAWDDPNDPNGQQANQFAPPTQAPNFGKPMGAPALQTAPNMDSPDQPWNKPIQAPQAAAPAQAPPPAPAAAPAPGGAWGAPTNGPDNWAGSNQGGWEQPPAPETPQPAPAAQAPGSNANNPWPAAPGGANPAWGGNADSWQQGQPGGNQNAVPDSWATPPQQAPAWGQPGGNANSGANQAAPAPEPAAAAAPGAWGTQGNSGSAWGQLAQKPGDSWATPDTGQAGGGWGQPGGGNAWGGEQARAPEPVQAQAPAPQPAAKLGAAWSVDAEQIETGTWRAFTPSADALVSNAPAAPKGWGQAPQAAPAAPAMPPPPPPQGEQNRWDVPIQDRAGGPQAAPDANQNRWDTPIQSRSTQEPAIPQAQAPAPAANNPWGVPIPAQAPPLPGQPAGFGGAPAPQAPQSTQAPQSAGVAGTGIPKDSIMDRLSNVLAEGQAAPQQSAEESRWDLPIQERMKQDAMAGGGAPGQAPAAKAPGENRWDTPIQDRSSQPQAPELSPPPPRWDVPIQERTQQLTPTSATPAGDQLAPQAAAPTPWGSPPPAPQAAAPAAALPPPPVPFASPGDQGITASSWDLPVVEAQDQLHQRTQPESGMPSAPGFAQPFGAAPPAGGSPSRLNINPPAFTPGQPVAQPAPMAPPQLPPQAAGGGALFNVDDSEIDKIFSEHLGINEGGPAPAPAKPEGPPQPAIMKSLPISPPGQSAGGWGQPFGAPPVPGQAPEPAPQPFAAPPAPQMQPFAAPEPQPFTASVPEPQPFASPAPAPMPFAAPAPEPMAPPPLPFAAPPPAPFAQPEPAMPAPPAQPMQPFGAPPQAPLPFAPAAQAPPPAPFAAPEPAAQPFAPSPFGAAPGAPPAPGAPTGNPFAVPQQAPGASGQPKIVPVMSKNVATASGGPPASGWGTASASGGFPAAAPSNGPAPVPTAAPPAPFGAPAAPAPQVAGNKANGLFNLDDSAMDDLFSKNLGVQEMAKPVGGTGEQPVPAVMQNIPNVPPQPAFGQAPTPFGAPAQGAPPAPFGQPPAQENYGQASQPQPFAQPQAPQAPPQPFGAPFGQGQGQAQAPQPFGTQGPPPAPPQAAQPQGGGLFTVDDSMMNQIFADNLGVKAEDTQVNQGRVNVAAAVQAISNVAEQEPMAAVPPPKIEGLGRLDAKPDTGGDTGSGRIASIGKFLLDQKDLEKIGKLTASDLSDTKMKILTLEAASEIQGLLHHIGGTPDVVGSIIIGHDGLLIANTMPQDIEADSIGIWALAVYMNTETAIKKIGHNRVHQVVARTPRGFLVIADFGGGLLVTLSDGRDTDALIPLMRSITQVVSN